jgi:hypothetical protein
MTRSQAAQSNPAGPFHRVDQAQNKKSVAAVGWDGFRRRFSCIYKAPASWKLKSALEEKVVMKPVQCQCRNRMAARRSRDLSHPLV